MSNMSPSSKQNCLLHLNSSPDSIDDFKIDAQKTKIDNQEPVPNVT